jgi:hypothetical protein
MDFLGAGINEVGSYWRRGGHNQGSLFHLQGRRCLTFNAYRRCPSATRGRRGNSISLSGHKKPKPKTEAEITGTETKIQEILVFGHAIGLA